MKQLTNVMQARMGIITVAVLLTVAILALMSGTGFAQIDQVQQGIGATGDGPPGVTVDSAIASAINIFSFIVGVISVIMIIIGGLKYITSTGDSGKVDSAKNTILYAIIGLVVVVLAQVIVTFVLTRTTTTSEPEDDTSRSSSLIVQTVDQRLS